MCALNTANVIIAEKMKMDGKELDGDFFHLEGKSKKLHGKRCNQRIYEEDGNNEQLNVNEIVN